MSASLQKTKNPLVGSIAGALAGFSLVTIVFALILGVSDLRDRKVNHKLGVYASLIGAIAGAVVGATVSPKTEKKSTHKQVEKDSTSWQDWRNFVVDRKVKESAEITSFYLKPQDNQKLPDYKPGQFLTIKLDIPEQSRPVIRTYSISDYNNSDNYYRLSIKRECPPKNLDVPPGVASNFMHDRIEEGSSIPCKPPNGKFYIDPQNSLPAVLISNGVGITPMIAMAKACIKAKANRHIWFLHGARNGDYHAFSNAMLELEKANSNLHLHYKYSRPRSEDEGIYHSKGYVDKELLETKIIPEIDRVCGSTEAEYYLCGSPAFMDSIRTGLNELKVLEDRVFFESFSGGKTKGVTKETTNNNGSVESAEITFAASGKTLTWQKGDGTILEFAEANDINPDYSCRQGVCLTCMCELQEGEVEYVEEPTNEPDEGNVLICISQPKTSKVVLDL